MLPAAVLRSGIVEGKISFWTPCGSIICVRFKGSHRFSGNLSDRNAPLSGLLKYQKACLRQEIPIFFTLADCLFVEENRLS